MKNKRVALVTGGAQGIGRQIAYRFLEDDYHIVVADSDAEAVAEVAAENRPGLDATVADISCETEVLVLFQYIEDNYGRLDVLINNAAIVEPVNARIDALLLEDWNRVIATNLTGAFLCTKLASPLLVKAKGSIVNIASTRALMSEPNTEAYAASKGGLVALTHALAMSLGPDVRVNSISPGWISTAHLQKRKNRTDPVHTDADHRQHPVGRVGRPEDIAAMAAYLAAPEAGFITGQNFVVDGGMTRKMIYVEE